MRHALCLLVLLGGCQADPLTLAAAVGATTAGSVMVIQRTPVDAMYSLLTGRDCSAVRLDQGKGYCRPADLPPAPVPYCTRSLGVADCWANPDGQPRELADGPRMLTPTQDANRLRHWPF